MAKRKTVIETIRDTIKGRKLSGYQIAKDTGLPQSTLSRFARGEQNIGGEIVDRLCEYLGLELVERKGSKKK